MIAVVRTFALSLLVMLGLSFTAMPAAVYAQDTIDDNRDAACEALQNGCKTGSQAGEDFNKLWATIINIVSFIAGSIAIIMIIVGGLRYILSSGDPNSTGAARNTIIYALVGLVIVVAARTIVLFVIGRL